MGWFEDFTSDPIGTTFDTTLQLGTGGLVGYDADSNKFGPGVVTNEISRATGIGQPGQPFQIDHSGKPIARPYQSTLTGEGYNAIKSNATNKSMNPWAALALSRQKKSTQKNLEDAAIRTAGQTAQSEAKLASTGGLTSGARERTVQSGQKNYMDLVNDINNQGDLNALQIGIQDAEGKQKAQQLLTQLQIGDNTARNAYDQNIYNQNMEAWAAEQQARATENSGGK